MKSVRSRKGLNKERSRRHDRQDECNKAVRRIADKLGVSRERTRQLSKETCDLKEN